MSQGIINNQGVKQQLNIDKNYGHTYMSAKPTRWSNRFARLNQEVAENIKIDDFIDDLLEYNTALDGKSMTEKLQDGNFSETDIILATKQKEKYWKKFEKNKFYETAQIIDTEIFALIKFNFDTYVFTLIKDSKDKNSIKIALNEKVITPIMKILNEEGAEDSTLNYSIDDILGMLYSLTGKCHINWFNYDNI